MNVVDRNKFGQRLAQKQDSLEEGDEKMFDSGSQSSVLKTASSEQASKQALQSIGPLRFTMPVNVTHTHCITLQNIVNNSLHLHYPFKKS